MPGLWGLGPLGHLSKPGSSTERRVRRDGRGHPSPSAPPALPWPAGNCVVLKPSEFSRSTEKVLAEVLPRYLDQVSRAGRGPSSYPWAEQGQAGPLGQDPSSTLNPASPGLRGHGRVTTPQPLSLWVKQRGGDHSCALRGLSPGDSHLSSGHPCLPRPSLRSPKPQPGS